MEDRRVSLNTYARMKWRAEPKLGERRVESRMRFALMFAVLQTAA